MEYKKLSSLFHQDEEKWNSLYNILYSFPLTRHFEIPIRQSNANKEFLAFFYYTEDEAMLLSEITKQLVKLTNITNALTKIAVRHFKRSCLIEEIQSSNDIEGVKSTKKEITAAIDEQFNIKNQKNIRLWGIANKYIKLQELEKIPFNSSLDLRTFYNDFILSEVARDNPKNVPDGKIFRASKVDIWSKTKIIHSGVYPEEKIIDYINRSLKILQDETIPGLIRISIFHYLFGYIHPFYDGNGRTSRFITSYYLSRMLNPLVAIRLSITIKKSLRTYYKLFEETNSYGNRGDLTPFITGFLWLILKSISRVNELLVDKSNKLSVLNNKLNALNITNPTDKKIYFILLQAALFSVEGATLQEIASTIGITSRTVRNHLDTYPDDHIIVNATKHAHQFMLNTQVLK